MGKETRKRRKKEPNFSLGADIELSNCVCDFLVTGRHIPQTYYEPAEYPTAELVRVRFGGTEVPLELVTAEDCSELEERAASEYYAELRDGWNE